MLWNPWISQDLLLLFPTVLFALFSGLVLLGMVSGLVFLLFHFHLELVPCFMSLLYPDLHSLVPRSALHMAGDVSGGASAVFFKSTLSRRYNSPATFTWYDRLSSLLHTIAFFHSFWPFVCGFIRITSPGCNGWSGFSLWSVSLHQLF